MRCYEEDASRNHQDYTSVAQGLADSFEGLVPGAGLVPSRVFRAGGNVLGSVLGAFEKDDQLGEITLNEPVSNLETGTKRINFTGGDWEHGARYNYDFYWSLTKSSS